MRVFQDEDFEGSRCPRQGEGSPQAPSRVRVVDGQVRLG